MGAGRVIASAPEPFVLSTQDTAAADWSDAHAEPAGRFTDTLHGASSWMLPPGTEARDAETGALIGEVLRHGDRVLLARGGRGGRVDRPNATLQSEPSIRRGQFVRGRGHDQNSGPGIHDFGS